MTDIALRLHQPSPTSPARFDIENLLGDLVADDGLRTAVTLALLLDRRADVDDLVYDGDRRGSWQDQYLNHPNDKLGSRLWLLRKAPEDDHTLQRARAYADEALQWMVEDRIARKIETEALWVQPSVLGLRVTITLLDGSRWIETINYSMGN